MKGLTKQDRLILKSYVSRSDKSKSLNDFIVANSDQIRHQVKAMVEMTKALEKPSRLRTVTIYRDDSTTQVVLDRVKSVFWTAGNTVLVIARMDNEEGEAHHYLHWPRERFCWFKDQPNEP